MRSVRSVLSRHHRVIALAILVTIALLLVLVQPVHTWLLTLFEAAEGAMRDRAAWGMIAFVLLAALSAMVAVLPASLGGLVPGRAGRVRHRPLPRATGGGEARSSRSAGAV